MLIISTRLWSVVRGPLPLDNGDEDRSMLDLVETKAAYGNSSRKEQGECR